MKVPLILLRIVISVVKRSLQAHSWHMRQWKSKSHSRLQTSSVLERDERVMGVNWNDYVVIFWDTARNKVCSILQKKKGSDSQCLTVGPKCIRSRASDFLTPSMESGTRSVQRWSFKQEQSPFPSNASAIQQPANTSPLMGGKLVTDLQKGCDNVQFLCCLNQLQDIQAYSRYQLSSHDRSWSCW